MRWLCSLEQQHKQHCARYNTHRRTIERKERETEGRRRSRTRQTIINVFGNWVPRMDKQKRKKEIRINQQIIFFFSFLIDLPTNEMKTLRFKWKISSHHRLLLLEFIQLFPHRWIKKRIGDVSQARTWKKSICIEEDLSGFFVLLPWMTRLSFLLRYVGRFPPS